MKTPNELFQMMLARKKVRMKDKDGRVHYGQMIKVEAIVGNIFTVTLECSNPFGDKYTVEIVIRTTKGE